MYTQCPECKTIFEIDEDALQASLGIVQCGRCSKRFDALRTLSDTLPLAPLTPLPEQDATAHAPTLTEAVPPSAYESAARKQRRGAGTPDATAGQHELELAPSAPAMLAAGNEPSRTSADDWFADLETELAAASSAEPPAAAAEVSDDDSVWMVELPDETGIEAADTGSASPPSAMDVRAAAEAHATGESAEAAASSLVDEQSSMAPEPNPLDFEPEPDTETIPVEFEAPSVVSPRLLQDDVFDADTSAPSSAEAETAETPTSAQDTATDASADAEATTEPESGAGPATAATEPANPPTPVYVRPHRHRISGTGLAWAAGCLVLALALAVQLAWANRVDLIRNPATRGWTESLCRSLPCLLPPIKDVARLELVSRDVRPDPNASGALTITATVRNDASFRQPWPVVTVELTDVDNHVVAMRRFRPADYMPNPARRDAGIAPGATAALAFEVADPGKNASGFRFSFE